VVSRLLARHRQKGTVEDCPRSGRLRKTTPREDSYHNRQAKLQPFSTAVQLRGKWPIGGRISVRTVVRRLHSRPVKRPELTLRHRQARLQWSRLHRHWNLRCWKRIYLSDESRFLLKPVDGRIRVWKETEYSTEQQQCSWNYCIW